MKFLSPFFLNSGPPRLRVNFSTKILITIFLVFFASSGLFAQQGSPFDDWTETRGDPAIAERYFLWIQDTVDEGQWQQAATALERANDFADVSSDISYLKALVFEHENRNRGSILQALGQAIATGRWNRYTEADARFLQAQHLIALRRYSTALECLAIHRADAGDSADSSVLRLEALKGLALSGLTPPGWSVLPVQVEFRRRIFEAMDRYPRDPRPVRILFDYVVKRDPTEDDIILVELALRRLPILLEIDGELAWMAAPFVADIDEARRLLGAYRSGTWLSEAGDFRPTPASLVPALNLGLLDDMDAIEELFTEKTLDKDLILDIGALLRSEDGREGLVRKLHAFTGTITEDEDRDGFPESRATYREGVLQEYRYDADQDGIDEMVILFDSGIPRSAEIVPLPSALPPSQSHSQIFWERFPSVEKVVLGSDTYIFPPRGFQFSPVIFEEIGATERYSGLLFPQRDTQNQGITRRMLSSFAASIQRPNLEFSGGVEHLYIERGIPFQAEVILNGKVVAVTEFENGIPVLQRLDLDLDGRMETIRHFNKTVLEGQMNPVPVSSESDWNGDGIFEYIEMYRDDGSIVYKWDYIGE